MEESSSIFEATTTSLKAFVAVGLEVGPDIGKAADSKLFSMNALGALLYEQGDTHSAHTWLSHAAEAGHSGAASLLAQLPDD